MMEGLLMAIAKHLIKNCPHCHGKGEVMISTHLGFDRPLEYAPCSSCKDLRKAIDFAVDPA